MLSANSVAFAVSPAAADTAVGLRGAGAALTTAPAALPEPAASGPSAAPWVLGAVAVAAAASGVGRSSKRPVRGSRSVQLALPAAVAASGAPAVAQASEAPAVEEDAEPPFDPAKQVGVTDPLGYFDPLGFCKVGDYEGFHRLRSAEIKHGRVAMMAAFGTVFQHFVKLPFFDKTPAGLGALSDGAGVAGFLLLLAPLIGFLEVIYWKDDLSKEPGNFGDPGNWQKLFAAVGGGYSDDIRNKEINNGRMAMISILGIVAAEVATGRDGIQQFGL